MPSGQSTQRIKTILVHQMGKVGSRSVVNALERIGQWEIVHLHQLNKETLLKLRIFHEQRGLEIPLHIHEAERIQRDLIDSKQPLCIITMVREPIARNISAFFQNLEFYNIHRKNINVKNIDDVIQTFLSEYDHTVPLDWFDQQVKKPLGLDVYQYPFPHQKGYQIINKDLIHMLIIKCEIDDMKKVEAITKFFGISSFRFKRYNEASTKNYARAYKSFKRKIRMPVEYIENMCQSCYMRHFYSQKEILDIKDYWINNKNVKGTLFSNINFVILSNLDKIIFKLMNRKYL